jgi:hypothetical protein
MRTVGAPSIVRAGLVVLSMSLAVPAAADTFNIEFPGTIQIVDDDDGSLKLRLTSDGRTLKAQAKGHFEFTEDETDFASVSPGGWFWIEERRRGRTAHRIEVRETSGGSFERKYELGGKEHVWDADGKAWLASALGEIFRNTSFAAEDHIRRVYQRSGVDGALDEIARSRSDHAQRTGYVYLLKETKSDAGVASRIAQHAAEEIGSDHQLAELILELVEVHPEDPQVLGSCVETSKHIGSDHERRRALSAILDPGKPTTAVLSGVYDSATGIGSDHELAQLLIEAINVKGLEDVSLAGPFFTAVNGIGSDHECARVLTSLSETKRLEPAVLAGLLESSRRIGSDHEKARVLLEVAAAQPLGGAVRDDFLDVARSIGSDHERGRVMDALQAGGL